MEQDAPLARWCPRHYWRGWSPSVRLRSDSYCMFNHFRCLNYADITFKNGEVQSVDFEEKVRTPGTCRLLDIANGRHVKTVKILARAPYRARQDYGLYGQIITRLRDSQS